MTIGTRIAQKRKESGLSQESLGEQLGVSRQAIYKWESDTALPEIEKLIALSRLFRVSVGWLLGVEDTEHPAADTVHDHNESSDELTETQLKMVEEIVARYLAAQPQPLPKKRRALLKVCIAAAGICLAMGMYNTVARLDRLNSQYNNLQHSVSNISSNVNSQINGISNRVESILKAQNHLAADYGTELTATDLRRNTVTFSARAVPKTFQDGMSAVFLADSGDGPAEFPAELSPGRAFTGEITTELTDNIVLSVVFISPDGVRQTQLLDTYADLLTVTFPDVNTDGHLTFMDVKDGAVTFSANDSYIYHRVRLPENDPGATHKGLPVAAVESVRMGLFKNGRLVQWLTACEKPATFRGWEEPYWRFFMIEPGTTVEMTKEDKLTIAALITDEYGRERIRSDGFYTVDDDGKDLTPCSGMMLSDAPADWGL